MKALTQISRILVGVLFIISGLIKANDTLGFSYKLLEYFEIFGMQFFDPFAVGISMIICIFEIVSGIALLLGTFARLNIWLLLLLIIFFTFLTGYSAITHKVTDCGCFGDALKLKPFESFMKDVVLLVLILIQFAGLKYIKPLFNNVITNIALSVGFLVSVFFTMYTYMFLPVKDFLPYKTGNNIYELTRIPDGAPVDEIAMIFHYKKGGQTYDFTADNLPDDIDTYEFINREDKVIKEGFKPPIHDFKIYDQLGSEYTDSFFSVKGYKLLLVQTKLEKSRTASIKPLSELAEKWIKSGRPIWALTSSGKDFITQYTDKNKLPFSFFIMDEIPLKSMVRSNPGLILLKDNVVIKKWSAYNLPDFEIISKYTR